MKNERWLAPHYYLDFSCKADRCRNNCCTSWKIPVSVEEYNKLITMDCSDELSRRIQNAFVMDESGTHHISFNWLGLCPIQEKGLCYLHREKGEKFLPKVCRLYPRSLKNVNGVNIASCSSSCEAVIELLYDRDNLNIEEIDIDEKPEIYINVDTETVEKIKSFNEIIKDRSTTLAESIYDICMIINKDEFSFDYYSDIDCLDKTISVFKRFYGSNAVIDEMIDDVNIRYKDSNNYYKDIEVFESNNKDWMSFFERVINNSMIYECFPFIDKKVDQTRVYKGLCCCYGLMRLVCALSCKDGYNKDKIIDGISSLFHLIDHTDFYYVISCIVDNTAIMLKM